MGGVAGDDDGEPASSALGDVKGERPKADEHRCRVRPPAVGGSRRRAAAKGNKQVGRRSGAVEREPVGDSLVERKHADTNGAAARAGSDVGDVVDGVGEVGALDVVGRVDGEDYVRGHRTGNCVQRSRTMFNASQVMQSIGDTVPTTFLSS